MAWPLKPIAMPQRRWAGVLATSPMPVLTKSQPYIQTVAIKILQHPLILLALLLANLVGMQSPLTFAA